MPGMLEHANWTHRIFRRFFEPRGSPAGLSKLPTAVMYAMSPSSEAMHKHVLLLECQDPEPVKHIGSASAEWSSRTKLCGYDVLIHSEGLSQPSCGLVSRHGK